MKSTTDYWVNEWLKLYFIGYPNWLAEKMIYERMGKDEGRTEIENNILSSTPSRV